VPTRSTWHDIAFALGELRAQHNDHAAIVDGIERAARTVCKVLQASSTRFDSRRFMRVFHRNKTLP
jgi:hypothetical protein